MLESNIARPRRRHADANNPCPGPHPFAATDRGGGTPQFNNAGEFLKSAGAGTATIGNYVIFTNTGNVEVQSGFLSIGGTYTQTAGATNLNGGDITRPLLALDGGEIRGTGTVTGDVSISMGATSPGLSAGLITITGSYLQEALGAYDVEIGGLTPGTDYDRIDLTGAGGATLNGALDVR